MKYLLSVILLIFAIACRKDDINTLKGEKCSGIFKGTYSSTSYDPFGTEPNHILIENHQREVTFGGRYLYAMELAIDIETYEPGETHYSYPGSSGFEKIRFSLNCDTLIYTAHFFSGPSGASRTVYYRGIRP